MLKLLRFKLMNRFPFVPAQLLSMVLQPLSQAGSKHYSDKTKPSFTLALPPRLLRNNIYKIAIRMGGDSKNTSVQVRLPGYKIPGIKSALQHKSSPRPRVCLFQSIFPGRTTSCLLLRTCLIQAVHAEGIPEAVLLHSPTEREPFGSARVYLDSPHLSTEQGGTTTHSSKLSKRKGEPVTEVTAEPRVTRTTGLAPWQPQFGTICASSRTQESILVQLLAREIGRAHV